MIPDGCVERCPACPHRSFSPEESGRRKMEWAEAELSSFKTKIRPLLAPDERWGYRRKALLHARWCQGWQFGLVRRRGREEEFLSIPHCPLHSPETNRLFLRAAALASRDLPLVYGMVSGRALTLVLKSRREERWLDALAAWKDSLDGASLLVNWNPGAGRRALDSKRTELVFGCYWAESDGLWHGPTAFRQQISEMERKALEMAKDYLAQSGRSLVVDLYCGLGASLKEWGSLGWAAAGVELSGESLEAAARNAPGATLFRGRVEDRLPQLDAFLQGKPFVAYLNPPRSGLGEKVLRWLKERAPERIAYLSCHPRSLNGDLAALAGAFEVEALQPMDFFPQTAQLETLALLAQR